MMLNKETEMEIKKRAFGYLEECRKNDVNHTKRTVVYGRTLLAKEGGDESIVIPSIYFHDTGRCKLKDPRSIEPSDLELHMKYGAEIVRNELNEMKCENKKIDKIAKIVSIHDYPREIIEWEDIDGIIVMESDRLDRFGKNAISRFKELERSNDYILEHLENGKDSWFVTITGKKLADELFLEMKEILEEKSF